MYYSKKRIITGITALVLAVSLLFSGCVGNKTEDNSVDTDKHNQTGIAVNGVNISWANMKLDNTTLKLTDDQKNVLRYFDNDYFYISDYDSLQRYPKIFRHAQVEFDGYIVKLLEANDETYTCLAKLLGGADMYGETGENYELNENYIVITGQQPDDGRVIEGDEFRFYGRYNDVISYTIDGKESYYPTVSAFYAISGEKFDAAFIKKVAKIIFGSDIKLEDPMQNSDYMPDENHPNGYVYYLVTLDNQTNANFSSFEFDRLYGFIRDANLKENIERQFFVSADFQHYIITVFDRNLHTAYLEYYDRDFQKIWGKELENTDTITMDYTKDAIYIVTNNDLYGIDIANGEFIFDPVFVGEKIRINLLEDGVVLIGKGNKDNIMKTDLKGNIVWKTSIDLEVESCSSLQIVDGNIIGYYYSPFEDLATFMQKMVSVDKDGNIVSEFVCDNLEVVM